MLILKQFLKLLHFGTFWHGIIGSKLWLRENVGYLTYFTRLDGECSPYASKKDTNRSVRKFYPASYFYRKQTKLDGHDPTIGLFGLAKRQSLHHRPVRNPIVNRLPPTPTKPTCPAAAIGTSRTQRPPNCRWYFRGVSRPFVCAADTAIKQYKLLYSRRALHARHCVRLKHETIDWRLREHSPITVRLIAKFRVGDVRKSTLQR